MLKRKCFKCKIEKEATLEFFHADSSRLNGIGYKCKECSKGRKDPRIDRWKTLTEKQKVKVAEHHKKYRKTRKCKVTEIISSYRKFDNRTNRENNLTKDFVNNVLDSKCFYCGDKTTGCDRKDNKLGHIMSNCVPCCKLCNVTRMDNYTHEEMIELGKVIQIIKEKRSLNQIQQ